MSRPYWMVAVEKDDRDEARRAAREETRRETESPAPADKQNTELCIHDVNRQDASGGSDAPKLPRPSGG